MKNEQKRDIRLIAFDLDNTFLDSRKQIPEENLRAVEAAVEKGIIPVPATGRLYNGLPSELRELPYFRYYILINGAKVYDAAEDKVLYAADLTNERALSLFAHARETGCFYDCYLRDQGLMDRASYDRIDEFVSDRVYADYMRSIRKPVEDLSELVRHDGGAVQKVQYFFKDLEERTAFTEFLKDRGIVVSFHYVPLHTSPAGQKFGRFHGEDVYTTRESQRLTRLPMFYQMSGEDQETVVRSIYEFFGKSL